MKNDIKIQTLDLENIPVLKEALDMMNRTQGDGIFQMNYLTSKIERKDALVLGAFINGELISVGGAEIISDLGYYVPFEQGIQERLRNQKVGSLCTLCVREDFQGKGIGQAMSTERLNWLKDQNCQYVVGVSWLNGLQNTSDRVFQKLGFQLINEVKEFYKESAIKYPFVCPGCKNQPCLCSAALYQYMF